MSFPEFHLALPPWVTEKFADPTRVFATVEERMRVVIELSALAPWPSKPFMLSLSTSLHVACPVRHKMEPRGSG
ncbi:MAG: hypothetical protein AB7G75_04410 [Candidatus Binatia bacterium]